MTQNIQVLAVIPARGGSKEVPRKNLALVAGVSLVARTIEFAKESKLFDHIHVSTDDPEIANEASKFGLKPEFLRSDGASSDRASSSDVLLDVRHQFANMGCYMNRYVLLEPTSPMREAKYVKESIELTNSKFDASLTLSPVDARYHPDKQFKISNESCAEFLTERGRGVVARQELSRTYIRNGFCYVVTDVALLSKKSIFGSKLGAVVCDIPFINIDSHDDLERCRAYFEDKDHGS